MTYPQLTLVVLGGVAVIAAVLVVVARRRGLGWVEIWAPAAVSFGVLAVLTAVFDNLIILSGLVAYDPATLGGPAIGVAPLEDFAYPLATALLLPLTHRLLLGRTGAASADAPHPDAGVTP